MDFNKQSFESLRRDIEEALWPVAEKYELKIKAGKITYSEMECQIKLEAVRQIEGVDNEKERFETLCRLYGFTPEQYKMNILYKGERYQLVGFNPTKPKNRCNILNLDSGKVYVCTTGFVNAYREN